MFFDRISTSTAGLKLDWTRGSFLSRDHKHAVDPGQAGSGTAERRPDARDGGRSCAWCVDRVLDEWDEIAGPNPPPAPEVELGGRHMVAYRR